MNLAVAEHYAVKAAEALIPFCERIEIAGSIRRRRPHCNDIDLVVLPRLGARDDIIARGRVNSLLVKQGMQYVVFEMRNGLQLDLWFAHRGGGDLFAPDPPNFGVLWLTRTGSAAHNIFIAQRAKERGMHFNPHRGLEDSSGAVIASEDEPSIFDALDLDYVCPEDREK